MLSSRMEEFERNRYFYGKLLTAQDFQCEQKYFNDKRRLLNCLLYGSGVICGLGTVKLDDTSIVVESGAALDSGGREIVLGQAVVKKLASIKGFDRLRERASGAQTVYLCLEYCENLTEPMYSIAKNAADDDNDGAEYNKIKESHALFLTENPPKKEPSFVRDLTKIQTMLWEDESVRVWQTTDQYVTAGNRFYIETHIEKQNAAARIEIEYKMNLSFITASGEYGTSVNFSEPIETPQTHYCVKTALTAGGSYPQNGEICVCDFKISKGGKWEKSENLMSSEVSIVQSAYAAVSKKLRDMSLQDVLDRRESLYIARIQVMISSEYYVIDNVDSLPFEQTVYSPVLARCLNGLQSEVPEPQSITPKNVSSQNPQVLQSDSNKIRSQTGAINLNIPAGAKKGKCYFSAPTPHLLGPGTVFIMAGLSDDENIVFENASPFDVPFEWGVSVDKQLGLFKIGVRLSEDMPCTVLSFSWIAVRTDEARPAIENTLSIIPSVHYAARRETLRFEAKNSAGEWRDGELEWSVNPPDGGHINENGVFTAYDKAGFYEIKVSSKLDRKLQATAFVVVK